MQVYYWRHGHAEVDWILRQGDHVTAIEVKSGRVPRQAHQGLMDFRRIEPAARVLTGGSGGVPINECVSTPAAHWLRA